MIQSLCLLPTNSLRLLPTNKQQWACTVLEYHVHASKKHHWLRCSEAALCRAEATKQASSAAATELLQRAAHGMRHVLSKHITA